MFDCVQKLFCRGDRQVYIFLCFLYDLSVRLSIGIMIMGTIISNLKITLMHVLVAIYQNNRFAEQFSWRFISSSVAPLTHPDAACANLSKYWMLFRSLNTSFRYVRPKWKALKLFMNYQYYWYYPVRDFLLCYLAQWLKINWRVNYRNICSCKIHLQRIADYSMWALLTR